MNTSIRLLASVLACGSLLISCNKQSNGTAPCQPSDFPSFPPENVDHVMDMKQMWAQIGIDAAILPPHVEDTCRPALCRPTHPSMKFWTDEPGYAPSSPANYMIKRSQWGEWTNFTEDPARIGQYTPIDLLRCDDGHSIQLVKEWERIRRKEVLKHCQEDVWGVVPEAALKLQVTWQQTSDVIEHDGRFTMTDYNGIIDTSSYPAIRHAPVIRARLYRPCVKGKIPVIIQLGQSTEARPSDVALYECLSHNWGYMIFDCTALQPDNGAYMTDYLIGLVNKGNWRKPQDWGAMAAWSWGVSRIIDFLEDDRTIDSRHIGVTGHSRYGKTALLAMAHEPRLAIAYVSCSGVLGAAPMRTNWGENMEVILSEGSYHWVAGNAFKWVGALNPEQGAGSQPRRRELLTVDAHSLLALAAPRPVFISGGTDDSWANPLGMYCTCRDASPVYNLYGVPGLIMQDRSPIPDKAYIDGTIAYRLHTGGHNDQQDWPAFAAFVVRHFKIQ